MAAPFRFVFTWIFALSLLAAVLITLAFGTASWTSSPRSSEASSNTTETQFLNRLERGIWSECYCRPVVDSRAWWLAVQVLTSLAVGTSLIALFCCALYSCLRSRRTELCISVAVFNLLSVLELLSAFLVLVMMASVNDDVSKPTFGMSWGVAVASAGASLFSSFLALGSLRCSK